MENRSSKIYGFIRCIRPEIIILGVVCVFISGLVFNSELFSLNLLLEMFAMFCMAARCHPFNDYSDYEIEKIKYPNRALPLGIY